MLARDLAEHGDRIEELLSRALERDQRSLGASDRVLRGEVLELAARLGDPGACLGEVEVEVLELDHAHLLLIVALVLRLLADRVDLVGGEVADHTRLRDDATLPVGEVGERSLLRERVGAAGLLDREPRAARLVEDAALIADHRVEARLELALALAQLVADRLGPRAYDREVRERVGVVLAQACRVGEPRDGLLGQLERLRQVGALAGLDLLGVLGVREAEIVCGAEAQLGIDASRAARLEQRLLGGLVIALREQLDTLVVLLARGTVLSVRARGDEHEHDQRSHRILRSPAPAPTHSAASRQTSEASTGQA